MIGKADDLLLAELRAAFALYEPVPASALAAGKTALSWISPAAVVAALTADTVLDSRAGVRDGLGADASVSRLLTFTAGRLTVELETDHDGPRRVLVGRLDPPGATAVRVRWQGGELRCHPDGNGHFTAEGVPAGLISLELHLADATAVVTSWVKV